MGKYSDKVLIKTTERKELWTACGENNKSHKNVGKNKNVGKISDAKIMGIEMSN